MEESMSKINLVYQSWREEKYFPNGIPWHQYTDDYLAWKNKKPYTNVMFHLEWILQVAGHAYHTYTLTNFPKNERCFVVVEPYTCDQSFFYENVFHYLKTETIDAVNNNSNLFLLIWFPTEGFSLDIPNFMHNIAYTFSNKGINPEKVKFVFGDHNIKRNLERWKQSNHKGWMNIDVYGFDVFIHIYRHHLNLLYKDMKAKPELLHEANLTSPQTRYCGLLGARTRYFLCKNGAARDHRTVFVSELHRLGIAKKGFVSFINRYGSPVFPAIENYISKSYERQYGTRQAIYQGIADFIKRTPLILDYNSEEIKVSLNQQILKHSHYANTYFSMVTETLVENDLFFVTEKTYMPIAGYHPFIILGPAGILRYLHGLGFVTFPEIFDESYDSMTNLQERFFCIMENMRRVTSLPLAELHKKYKSVLPKIIHNRNLFFNIDRHKHIQPLINWLLYDDE